jgi:hypothetical protein
LKVAGQLSAGRKVSSSTASDHQVVDTIDFIHEPLWKDKDFLHQKYVIEGRSIRQISEEILSSRAAVRDRLIEFGIKRKAQGKPGLRPAQVPYGHRLSNGVMVPHLGEQRVLSSVKKMVSNGLSYRKVCEFLTSVGVPTKKRGQRWHPETVRRLLNTKTVEELSSS